MPSKSDKIDKRQPGRRDGAHPLPFRPRPDLFGDDFLDETIAVWQPLTIRTLTREDAREIIENMTGFFTVLRELSEAKRRAVLSDDAHGLGTKNSVELESQAQQTQGD